MKSLYYKVLTILVLLLISQNQPAKSIQVDSASSFLKQELLSGDFKKEEEIVEFLDVASKLYANSPTDALFYVNALEQKLEAEKNSTARAYILSRKGTFYWLQGIYDASLEAYFAALKIFEETDNSLEIIKVLNNIGETYKKQKDYTLSAKFIKLALAKTEVTDGISPELILVNLGQLFMLKENYDSADYYLNLILDRDSVGKQSKGFAFLYKGIMSREIGQYDSAKLYIQQSLRYWNELNYKRGIVESAIENAKIYLEENEFDQADYNLRRAELLASKINTLDLLLSIYRSKIDLLKFRGSKDSLILYFDKYLKIKDSIFSSESRAEINKLTIQYDLAEKEKERYKLALQQSELSNQIQNRTLFLVLLILVLIFAIVFILYLRNKSKQLKSAHLKLQQQKAEIEDKQDKLASKSLALAEVNNELHQLNNTLEQRVVERTQKLNERNKQIAEFTYYNSHKLRAPVASVLGLINVIESTKEGKIDPIVLEHLKTSATELDKVIYNLKNLLDLNEDLED